MQRRHSIQSISNPNTELSSSCNVVIVMVMRCVLEKWRLPTTDKKIESERDSMVDTGLRCVEGVESYFKYRNGRETIKETHLTR